MAGGGSGGGNKGGNGSGSTGSTAGPFSWSSTPAKFGSTADPKAFGTTLINNLDSAFKQGPQSTIPSYNPFTAQTSGLINQGLGQVASNAGGPLADFASGKNLGAGNPYLNDIIRQNDSSTTAGVNSTFNSSGLFGSDVHAQGLAQGLQNSDNQLRYADYQNGFDNMLNAQRSLADNTANGLAYSGLLDSKNAEKIASDQQQQAQQDPYSYISKYWNLLNGNQPASSSNVKQPTSLWDILGGIGSFAGSIL